MKALIKTICAMWLTSAVSAQDFQSIEIGTSIPKVDVKMKDVSNKTYSIADVEKKNGTLVMFSCNTCPYVIKNQERTKEIAAYATKNQIGVIIINSNEATRNADDSFEAMKQYAKNQNYQWPYVVDEKSEVANAFGATRTPEIFLFNPQRKLVYKGAIDDSPSDATKVSKQHLKNAIDELIAGKDITIKQSRSVGCTIKRTK